MIDPTAERIKMISRNVICEQEVRNVAVRNEATEVVVLSHINVEPILIMRQLAAVLGVNLNSI